VATTARRCAACGGPLPEVPRGERQQTCPFCGIVNDLTHAATQPLKIELNVDDVRKAALHVGRKVKLAMLLGVGIAALVVAIGILQAVRPVRDALREVTEQSKAMQERLRPIAPAELATVGESGWKEVHVPAPPSGWTTFDPIADIEWAMAIARAWQPDARLTRIDVTRVASTGTLNLTADLEEVAGYRFVSPGQLAEWERIADRQVDARVPYELMMNVARQKVVAHVVRGRPPARRVPPPPPDTQRLSEVISRAISSGRFAELPFYNGYLTHLDREGWVWYLQSLSRRESLPRVRARDGAVYPYR
jgi:hypothetical protein